MSTNRAGRCGRLHLPRLALLACLLLTVHWTAEAGQAHWTTNFYDVSGSSLREIRQSIVRSRPHKVDRDALTEWHIRTRCAAARIRREYRSSGFTTTTTVRITLPRWHPPPEAPEELIQQWNRYIRSLTEHEIGHGRIAEAAAREMQRRVDLLGTRSSSDEVLSAVEQVVNATLEEFRERERDYDRLTEHGATQGAILSGGRSGKRHRPAPTDVDPPRPPPAEVRELSSPPEKEQRGE